MMANERPWVQTAFGGRVHIPSDGEIVDPTEFSIVDVAYGLAGQSRFNGSLRVRYSVAQHSVWVANQLLNLHRGHDLALYGLLHDAHECFVSDLVTPIKSSMPPEALHWYRTLTAKFDEAIFGMAGLDHVMPNWIKDCVKKVDHEALCREAVLGMRGGPRSDWREAFSVKRSLQDQAAWEPLHEVSIEEAAEDFLQLYAMLQDFRGYQGGLHVVS